MISRRLVCCRCPCGGTDGETGRGRAAGLRSGAYHTETQTPAVTRVPTVCPAHTGAAASPAWSGLLNTGLAASLRCPQPFPAPHHPRPLDLALKALLLYHISLKASCLLVCYFFVHLPRPHFELCLPFTAVSTVPRTALSLLAQWIFLELMNEVRIWP